MRTRVKFCGITTPADARAAVAAGADAIGLVFHPPSPRAVTIEQADAIVRALSPMVAAVALFVDPDPDLVADVEEQIRPDLLQFHGDESAEFARRFSTPYLKAVRIGDPAGDQRAIEQIREHAGACGILADAWSASASGGTGRRFDWTCIPAEIESPLILAGGLDPDCVGEAVRSVRPYAVDVSGGIESAPGVKDADKMARFVSAVQAADRATSES